MAKKPSSLEALLLEKIREAKLPEPIREYKALKDRQYPWDFSWPEHRLLVEIQGAIYQRGAHSRGAGIERDMEKLNLATLAGYRCMQFSRRMIEDGTAVEMIRQALEVRTILERLIEIGDWATMGMVISNSYSSESIRCLAQNRRHEWETLTKNWKERKAGPR